MGGELRKHWHGSRPGSRASWYVEENCLKIHVRWTYLYRAVDRDGNLIDVMPGEHRDMQVAKAFFRPARATMGSRPDQVTTDGHGSYPEVNYAVLGKIVRHRPAPP